MDAMQKYATGRYLYIRQSGTSVKGNPPVIFQGKSANIKDKSKLIS